MVQSAIRSLHASTSFCCLRALIRHPCETAGPVNLPPDTAGLRAGMGMRKNRSYQWLEAACDPEATSPPETGRLRRWLCLHERSCM